MPEPAPDGQVSTSCRLTDVHDAPVSKRDPAAAKAHRALDRAGGLVHRGLIAKGLGGLSLQWTMSITEAPDFPDPYTVLGGRPIWITADVVKWAEEHHRAWALPRTDAADTSR